MKENSFTKAFKKSFFSSTNFIKLLMLNAGRVGRNKTIGMCEEAKIQPTHSLMGHLHQRSY